MDANWLAPTAIAIVVAVPLATLIGYLIAENIKGRRNRAYKSFEEHSRLNAGSRENWMAGVLPSEEVKHLGRFSNVIAPIVQMTTVIVLSFMIVVSQTSVEEQAVRQQEQIAALEAQLHALAFAAGGERNGAKTDPDPAAANSTVQPAPVAPSPMQLACANLIGRVADAYEKGASSKVAASLEELVKTLKCVNGMPP